MRYIKFVYIVLFFVLVGCQENRVKRLLPGSWNLESHKLVDQFGFMQDCSGSGTLELGNCKKGDCSFSFDFNSDCSGTVYNWNETGTYQVIEKGQDFLFMRPNPTNSSDTVQYQIYIVTSTDLKVGIRDAATNQSHEFLFSRD